MNGEGVRAQHLDRRAQLPRPERLLASLAHELRRADVGDEQGRRRQLPRDRVGVRQARAPQRGPLASQAHGQPVALRGRRQDRVHLSCGGVSACHAGDEERGAQGATEELDAEVDLVQVHDRQGLVGQVDVRPPRTGSRIHIPARAEAQVLGLAGLHLVHRVQSGHSPNQSCPRPDGGRTPRRSG